MRRHKSLIPLSQEHHHGLMLAQLLKKDAPVYRGLPTDISGKIVYAINAWNTELSSHFDTEENILFPFLKGRDEVIDRLIDDIIIEHRTLEKLFDKLDDNDIDENLLDEIGEKLEKHIRKEERVLFENIQSIFDDSLLNQLEKKMSAVKSAGNTKC